MTQEAISLIIGGAISLASICLTSIATLLTLVIGYVFQRKNEERRRQWELDDRLTNRSISVRHKRIEEVQSYVETMYKAGNKLESSEKEILARKVVETEDTEKNVKIWRETAVLLDTGRTELRSLFVLDDNELKGLFGKLQILFNEEMSNFLELIKTSRNEETIDEEILSERLSAFSTGVFEITTDMHRRLDELAQIIK